MVAGAEIAEHHLAGKQWALDIVRSQRRRPARGREAAPARMEAGQRARRRRASGAAAEVDLPLRFGTAVGVVYKNGFLASLFT